MQTQAIEYVFFTILIKLSKSMKVYDSFVKNKVTCSSVKGSTFSVFGVCCEKNLQLLIRALFELNIREYN